MAVKTKKKRARPKWTTLRFRKNDPTHNVLAAVSRWIRAHNGTDVVIGGVEVIQFPGDAAFNYRVAVKVTGKLPVKKPA